MHVLPQTITRLLPLILVAMALLAATAVGLPVYWRLSNDLRIDAHKELVHVAIDRREALVALIEQTRDELVVIASTNTVHVAMEELGLWWGMSSSSPKRHYTDESPYEPGHRDQLDRSEHDSLYDDVHDRHHPVLRKMARIQGFDDILLVRADGVVVYTVHKGGDFGAAVNVESQSRQPLARLVRRTRESSKEGFTALTDLHSDTAARASEDVASMFFGTPVTSRRGAYLGALVVRIGGAKIDHILSKASGPEDRAGVYAVGSDGFMRSGSRHAAEATLVQGAPAVEFDSEDLATALDPSMVSASDELKIDGLEWSVVAQMPEAEVLAPVYELRRFMIVSTLAAVCAASLVGLVGGRRLSHPIASMSRAMRELADGDLDADLHIRSGLTEVREMTSAFQAFRSGTIERLKAERLLSAVIDSTPSAIVIKDREGRHLLVNKEFERQYEMSGVGALVDQPEGVDAQTLSAVVSGQERCALESGAVTNRELTLKDGRTVMSTRFPVHNHVGEIQMVGAVEHDITERRHAEDEVLRLNAELEQRVARRTEALRVARDEAQAGTRAKAAFLAAMSHEIRTPINGVLGMADLMTDTALNTDQQQMLRTIKTSGEALLTLINDLLDHSKLEAGRLGLEHLPTLLSELVEEVLEASPAQRDEHGPALRCLVDPRLPRFLSLDPARIRQVLFNLVGNAVKFTASGEVRVDVRGVESSRPVGSRLRVDVTDTGIGMTEEQMGHLFKAFAQADLSTSRRFGGTGLGLSICKQLVELMGGEIGVTSQLGVGSRFWFEIPSSAAAAPDDATPEIDLAGVRVLLMGPADSGKNSRALLEHWGCHVRQVNDPKAFITGLRAMQRDDAHHWVGCVQLDRSGNRGDDRRIDWLSQLDPDLDRGHIVVLNRLATSSAAVANLGYLTTLGQPIRRSALNRAVAQAAARLAIPDARRDSRRPVRPLNAPDNGMVVLVAEDNVINQRVIGLQLQRLGYHSEIYDDGAQALEAWRNKPFAVVLTDHHMPVMSGRELTMAIRRTEQDSERPRTAIIAVTASAMREEIDACLAAGMDAVMVKPLKMSELEAQLTTWASAPEGQH